jgi:hypothetical protein
MWCAMPMEIRSPAASVTGLPSATVIAERLLQAHAVSDVGLIFIASARRAPGSRCERRHDQRSRRPTIH